MKLIPTFLACIVAFSGCARKDEGLALKKQLADLQSGQTEAKIKLDALEAELKILHEELRRKENALVLLEARSDAFETRFTSQTRDIGEADFKIKDLSIKLDLKADDRESFNYYRELNDRLITVENRLKIK